VLPAVILVIVLLAGVVWLVGAPLRAAAAGPGGAGGGKRDGPDSGRTDLEVAKEAKYREIRDAEMDHRTGKLSVADYRRLDRQLRAEAVEILRRLDELGPEDSTTPPAAPTV
jgi:hypothetical protein